MQGWLARMRAKSGSYGRTMECTHTALRKNFTLMTSFVVRWSSVSAVCRCRVLTEFAAATTASYAVCEEGATLPRVYAKCDAARAMCKRRDLDCLCEM
eukprot:scaffold112564_cov32-Tisochrysis_lutea.AAC.3